MAEAGAHLTATADLRPSIFELLAQEALMEAVRPALQHAAKVLAESDPPRFGFLWRRFDELYLLLDVLLQSHFLSRSSASFSENFYGLKRTARPGGRGPDGGGRGLDAGRRRLSLLLLCGVPYLRARLEAELARQRDEDDFSIRLARGGRRRLGRAAAAALPRLAAAWRLWSFCQQLLYTFGLAHTHNPLLWLAGVRLSRLTADDITHMESRETGRPQHDSVLQGAWCVLRAAAGGVAVSLSTSLSLGLFFLQFLDWFYSSDNQSAVRALTSLPAPPPPLHLQEAELRRGRKCPLCRGALANATALSTSGFVFCYRCIHAFVRTSRRCPLSGVPSEPQHLVKIYAPDG